MIPREWTVGEFKGQAAKIRLVDNSSGSWGHINFDDLHGDIACFTGVGNSALICSLVVLIFLGIR